MRHANGSWVWIWSRGQSLRDAKGNVTNLTLGTHIDITERKLAEEKLRESEVRFREVLENSIAASYKRSLLTNSYEYLSPVFKKIAGYTQEEMNSLPLETVIGMMHPNDIQPVTEGITKALTELNGMPNSVEYRFKHKTNDEYRWLRDEFIVMLDEKGQAVSLIGSVGDVTEQKSMEIKLRQSEERHRALVQNIADAIVLLNENREIVYQSSSVDRINGFSFEERDRKPAGMLLHPDDKPAYMEFLEKVYSSPEEPMECQFRIQHKKGYYIWVEGSMVNMLHNESVKAVIVNYHDITERKLAELKLRESEEKHRALIENISDAIILMNDRLKTTYRSPSVRRIIGYSTGEIRDKEIFDLLHPDDLKTTRKLFQQARNTQGIAIQGQFRVLHNSGHYIWVEGTVMNMLHIKSINALIVNFREITVRKKFEEQQLLITSIVNSSDDAIISKDLNGVITSWNKGAEKIFGYPSQEMIGQSIYKLIPAELKTEEELFLKKIKGGNSVDHYETRRCRKDGVLIDVSLTISPIKDAAGNIVGASKILSDITERKKAEEAIKQSEANYRQLFDNSPAPMWVIDEQTHTIVQVNQACIKNYGYSEEEFLGLNIRDISPDNEYAQESKTGMSGMFFMGSQWHVKKSGELINVLTSSIPARLNGEKSILMIAIDVTEKNLYEQKLTKAAIKAQEDERYEIGGELHDNVCQMLAGSLMFLGLMKGTVPKKSNELFDLAYKNITSATNEIRNLSHRLAPAFFDEETLEDAFKRLLKEFNMENKYDIKLFLDKNVKQQSLGRDQQLNLYRILQEQLRNIVKHSKATEIEVEVFLKKNVLQMRIADNGIGFDMKQAKGGIGLANMNRRAQLFSGTFRIDSIAGKGCEAVVEIPLAYTD